MPKEQLELDGLEAAPWYVKAGIRVGFPTVAALVLMWFVLHNVTEALTSTANSHAELAVNDRSIVENEQLIIKNQERIVMLLTDHQSATQSLERLVVCLSLARSDSDRTRCLAVPVPER